MRTQGFNNFNLDLISSAFKSVSDLGTTAISTINKTGLQGDVKAACGAKPLNLGPINKKKREAYANCAKDYTAQKLQQEKDIALANARALEKKSIPTSKIIIYSVSALLLVSIIGFTIYKTKHTA